MCVGHCCLDTSVGCATSSDGSAQLLKGRRLDDGELTVAVVVERADDVVDLADTPNCRAACVNGFCPARSGPKRAAAPPARAELLVG